MAFEVIQGFNVSKNESVDAKRVIANSETEMLAIKWVYKGLTVKRTETSPIEYWTCLADAATQAGTPNYTDIGDWEQFIGTSGTNGVDGTVWYTGTGVPAFVAVENDLYLDDVSKSYYKYLSATWVEQGTLKGDTGADGIADTYKTTATNSVTIPVTHATSVSLTVEADLAYSIGQSVIVAIDVSNYFIGSVTSYSGTTLILDSSSHLGTGTATNMAVNLSGAAGGDGADGEAGIALIHTEYDIELTALHISTIGGGYTAQNPYSASVSNDLRSSSEKNLTAGIIGDMGKNSISYNGTSWSNNGRWVGSDGAIGPGYDSISDNGLDANGDRSITINKVTNSTAVSKDLTIPKGPTGDTGFIGKTYNSIIDTNTTLSATLNTQHTYTVLATSQDVVLTLPVLGSTESSYLSYILLTRSISGRNITLKSVAPGQPLLFSSQTGSQISITLEDYGSIGVNNYVTTALLVTLSKGNIFTVVGLGDSGITSNSSGPNLVGRVKPDGTLNTVRSDGGVWTAELAAFNLGEFTVNRYLIKRDGIQVGSDEVMVVTSVGNSATPYIITAGTYPGIYFQKDAEPPQTVEFNVIVYLTQV